MSQCTACGRGIIQPPKRKYCDVCSVRASAMWKRRHRAAFARIWEEDPSGPPPWMDGWRSIEARRTYYREYMQKWRRRSSTTVVPNNRKEGHA